MRLTILCENSVGKNTAVLAEHGFSCLIESEQGNHLFDAGQGLTLSHNLNVLGRNLAGLRSFILSHGHYDHAGGLPEVLARTGPLEITAHPDIFRPRFWKGKEEFRFVGIPHREAALVGMGARFRLLREFTELAPGLFFTGEIPRRTPFEKGDPGLVTPATPSGEMVQDTVPDDISLLIHSQSGPVLLLGCAHAGMVNILRHIREQAGIDSLHAVIGGTHLAPADEEQFTKTVETLREFQVQRILVGHCTGQKRAAELHSLFGRRFSFLAAGSVLEF
ncbi:MAG: MBL fold metallo-hydrolase [Desulfuromonadaceae bacterium]|nr:MBL fold metallo-hydrolase [Desulfuromonadaceae bacterium]